MFSELKGYIERLTYYSEETGFAVARVKVKGERDLVTVVGSLVNPVPGTVLDMYGSFIEHSKFGRQFKIDSFKVSVPATENGIEKYLGSGLIDGIGPVMAKRIVKKFGKNTLDIIEKKTESLSSVSGIGKKRVLMIKAAWDKQRDVRDIILFLQSYDVSPVYAVRIFKEYKQNSIKVVSENPYRLAMDIYGIGFITSDKIAKKLGFKNDSKVRVKAGIIYVLNKLADDGHLFYYYEHLLKKSAEILEVDNEIILQAIAELSVEKRVVLEDMNESVEGFKQNCKGVYLSKFYTCETQIAERLKKLVLADRKNISLNVKKEISRLEKKLGVCFAEKQKQAIDSSLKHKIMVITGGPGTGKTTIINAIIKIYYSLGTKILLAAPTGRAAKRMVETTGHKAVTIHRLLEYSFAKGGFVKNDKKKLNCGLLIIDEASMIDTVLMHHLLKAVPLSATLILVGDVNQLPSVGAGSVLKDIIDSGLIYVAELNEIFRQARESLIIVNAHKINRGIIPELKNSSSKADFYFIEKNDPEKVLDIIVTLVKERIPKKFGFDPLRDIQVLTPMHNGVVGSRNLNIKLQEALNLSKISVNYGQNSFRINDKVMQIKNNYDKNVFNGDLGHIDAICHEKSEIVINFEGILVSYEFSELDEIVLAYAASIHKSQGSEYSVVIIPLVLQHYILLQKNLIYTGVTRGKKLVIIVGSKKALIIGIKNNKIATRCTYLKNRLQES